MATMDDFEFRFLVRLDLRLYQPVILTITAV